MKKLLSVLLVIVMCFCFSASTLALESKKETVEYPKAISDEELAEVLKTAKPVEAPTINELQSAENVKRERTGSMQYNLKTKEMKFEAFDFVYSRSNGAAQPYGSIDAYNLECGGNWYNYQDYTDDWGIIRLESNIGNTTGYYGLRWQSASYNGQSVSAIGYPAGEGWFMHYGLGSVTSSASRILTGNWNSTQEMSGGPLQAYFPENGQTAIGFVVGGTPGVCSDAMRIDEWIYNKFTSYRTQTYTG